nr:hypothetical protein [Tanacetum cinerariifolium]
MMVDDMNRVPTRHGNLMVPVLKVRITRFNTIITSLKALDESFSSRNHVRKFLRALPTKWRLKVTEIKESKDLSTLPLDELIDKLNVYEVVLEKDSEAFKVKKEKYKSLALKARKVSSDEEESCSGSDEDYAMAVRDFKKFFRRRRKFVRQPYEDKKSFQKIKYEKKGKEDRRCFKCGCWSESDEEEESKRDEICLMALDNNEAKNELLNNEACALRKRLEQLEKNKEVSVECESCFDLRSKVNSLSLKLASFESSSYFFQEMIENQRSLKDKHGIGFTKGIASTSKTKIEKLGHVDEKTSTIELRLVPPPDNQTIIGNKWAFKNKLDENGVVSRNKARLVAQGYNQIEGIDFDETYAPIARVESLRILFANAYAHDFKLFQVGVKSAFLNGFINKEFYVAQPPSFVNLTMYSNSKRLFMVLNKHPKLGTINSKPSFLIISELNFFLGSQIKQLEDGIFFNQTKYIKEMLKKFGLEDSKPIKTPMSSETKFTRDKDRESVNDIKYRGMIGSLLYLTATRSDIMFSIYLCVCFQEDPKTSHLEAIMYETMLIAKAQVVCAHSWDVASHRGSPRNKPP